MSERPDFLNQPAKLRERDSELQAKLKAEAAARGVVPTKDSRRTDFVDRSIAETKRLLRETDNAGRAGLKGRLKFLREERARLSPK
jgi:hypothetical protein